MINSNCPIAISLRILGDKWTLVIIRDLLIGKTKYKEFQDSPEKMPTNILAARLKSMVVDEIIIKEAYQERPVRYQYKLTEKGRDLIPVLHELARWSLKYYPESWQPPDFFWELKA